MAEYLIKNRKKFSYLMLPLIGMFTMVFFAVSVFPGWIRPAYSTLGAACVPFDPDSANPLLTACDVCNGEFCDTASSTCTLNLNPFGRVIYCQCITSFVSIPLAQTFVFAPVQSQGTPNDAYCLDISGGLVENSCRTAICTTNTTFDAANPTGCSFDYAISNTECINCDAPTPQSFNCGNGVCEQGIGETFSSCPEDCAVPGYQGDAPLPEGDAQLDAACNPAPNLISFGGNIVGSDACEDGDICTTNTCQPVVVGQLDECVIDPAGCSGNAVDFCCPANCDAAPNGPGTCNTQLDPNCDVDCLPPQDCEPTPSPSAGPATNLFLFGDGFLPCSLHLRGPANLGHGLIGLASLGVAIAFLIAMRQRVRGE